MSILDFNGVWKLNLEKSDIPPVTKGQILNIETDGFNITLREELVNDKDELLIISLSGTLDGKDNVVNGTPFADTVAYRQINPNTIAGIAKKNGLICVKEEAVLLEDKNTVFVTYISFDQNGNTIKNFGYFDRINMEHDF